MRTTNAPPAPPHPLFPATVEATLSGRMEERMHRRVQGRESRCSAARLSPATNHSASEVGPPNALILPVQHPSHLIHPHPTLRSVAPQVRVDGGHPSRSQPARQLRQPLLYQPRLRRRQADEWETGCTLYWTGSVSTPAQARRAIATAAGSARSLQCP